MTLIFVAVVFAFFCLAIYHTNYWKRRNISGPQSWPFFGSLLSLIDPKRPSVFVINEWTRSFGRIFGYQHGRTNVLVLSDPDDVYDVLVKKFDCFGERRVSPNMAHEATTSMSLFAAPLNRWRRLRSISNPAFSSSNLKQLFPILNDSAEETVRFLEKELDKNEGVDVIGYCRESSMQIVARVALGYKHVQQFQNNLVQMALGVIAGFGRSVFCHLSWMFPKLSLPFGKLGMLVEIFGCLSFIRLLFTVRKKVVERKAKHQQNGQNDGLDFIDFFLNAEATSDKVENKLFKKQMTIEETVSQCLVILLAGFETTSNTLTLIFYYLAQNSHEQKKLVDEIQEVIGDDDSILSYEHLNKLKAVGSFINEVLRLHPVGAFAVSRICTKETNINDLIIEVGTHIQIDVIALNTDVNIWGKDALEFKPERWLDKTSTFQSFAFGLGKRSCIGKELALMELKVILIHILRNFQILPVSKDPLNFYGVTTLCPTNIKIQLERRSNNH